MLTLADRVVYQRAIEEVYWRHRIWPKERPDPKPSFDEVMPPAELEKKVEDYLRKSQALEDYWRQPLSAEQLQAEMERMVQHTKQPEVLRELFEALRNDPFVIAECLARAELSERLVTNLYAHDQRLHGGLRLRAEAEVRAHRIVGQMKQTSGTYTEIELVRSDSAQDGDNRGARTGIRMTNLEWDEYVQRLAAMFGDAPITQIKTGVLSRLQEDDGGYYATAIVRKSTDRLKLATVEWRKEPLESWINKAENRMPIAVATASATYALPSVASKATQYIDNTWVAASSFNTPTGRYSHTAVWTGTEMIIWGGAVGILPPTPVTDHGKYNPRTGTWTTLSRFNVPSARLGHTAVWTGSEMIVWGGDFLNTGGKYNPVTDSWSPTSVTNAPTGRSSHTAVWTGSQMIVWGGTSNSGHVDTGGRYNPSINSWTTTSTTNAPAPRSYHTAVWTGSQMIVWGGDSGNTNAVNTGGRYNPSTNSWTTTSTINAPIPRSLHTAVWSGGEMVVWGGQGASTYSGRPDLNTGGKYNPVTNTWTVTSTINAPSARHFHTVVWTGTQMIVWGGEGPSPVNTGARYNPGTNSWIAVSTTNSAARRSAHTAVWTGTEMIVWGGNGDGGALNTGGRYNPATNTWIMTNNAPPIRLYHKAVWTGSEMIVWGGWGDSPYLNTGGRYNPSTDNWIAISITNAPSARNFDTAVWSGTEMIIWGGFGSSGSLNTGGKYNPVTDSWMPTSTANAPSDRGYHTAVWTGAEMIVWGGHNRLGNVLNTGGRYNPNSNTWVPTSTTNAPTARSRHTAVWTGNEVIIWGGTPNPGDLNGPTSLNTGGRYNPNTNTWANVSAANAPSARFVHTAIWGGSQMIVWGGRENGNYNSPLFNTGSKYNPANNTWTATSTLNAPIARDAHTAVWTGNEMIVWGGEISIIPYWSNTGGRYNPTTNTWLPTRIGTNAPLNRHSHTAVWTGSEMIVWGGSGEFDYLNSGGRYCAHFPASALIYDFNHDGKPDYVLHNGTTGGTAIWYLDNNIHVGGATTPTLPMGWNLIDVADFNRDDANDYALFNPTTRQTAIWYLSGTTRIGDVNGPTLPNGWVLAATADFNGDGSPDFVLYKPTTRQTAIWHLTNNTYMGAVGGPALPVGWSLVGTADFNRDGKPDYLLFNPSNHSSAIWYLSGATRIGTAYGPTIAAGYNLTGAGDFNDDSKPDYVLYNADTRRTAVWYLNNNFLGGGAFGPTIPAGWSLVRP